MVDGVRVVVPDSLNLITPYVLLEQQDWFEDGIKFLRRLLQPGQKVIDIGANCGVYTLSMAKTVGPTGHVWAFEPASSTARLLTAGIVTNGFTQVTLEKSALSFETGTAHLALHEQSELNALVHGGPATGSSETVPLTTMDACLEFYSWQDIELVKIDAEGEEANILKGGARFFAEQSPLVLFEVMAGKHLHLELVQTFKALGYNSYRLVPGLDVLVPFTAEAPHDKFLLNLFCCKPDRAIRLAARGFLVEAPAHAVGTEGNMDNHDIHRWHNVLTRFPYGAQLAKLWNETSASRQRRQVENALSLYFLSRDSSLSAAERFRALEASFSQLRTLCDGSPPSLRLASLSRVARDFGARTVAMDSLAQLCGHVLDHNSADLSEPFLAPEERFDWLPPGKTFVNWILSAAIEAFERTSCFSSFYSPDLSRQRLELIRDLGYFGPEMMRRSYLVKQRIKKAN